jgi:signal transduction histidine kinase
MNSMFFYCTVSGLFNAVISAVAGVFVLSRNPRSIKNITYFLFSLSASVWCSFYVIWQNATSYHSALFYVRWLTFGFTFIPVLHLHFVFTLLGIQSVRKTVLKWSYAFTFISAIFALTPYFVADVSPKLGFKYWPDPGILFHPFIVIWSMIVSYSIWNIYQGFRQSSGLFKNLMKYIFISTILGWAGGASNLFLWYNIPIPPLGNILVSVYLVILTYVIIRFRLMEVQLAITRTTLLISVYGLVVAIPGALVLWGRSWLQFYLGHRWWVVPFALYTILLIVGPFIYSLLHRRIGERFLKEQRHYQQTLLQASRGMTFIKDLDHLISLMVHILKRTIRITHASVYLLNKQTLQYECRAARGKTASSGLSGYAHDSLLVQYLSRTRKPVLVEEILYRDVKDEGPEFKRFRHTLKNFGAAVIVPSFVRENLLGFLVLGDKKSRQSYTMDDLDVLAALANQAALAIENCNFITELEMTQTQLFQAAKMADLGTMATGLGHQINNRFNVIKLSSDHAMFHDLEFIFTCIRDGRIAEAMPPAVSLKSILKGIGENAIRGGEIVKRLTDFSAYSDEVRAVNLNEAFDKCVKLWDCKINTELVELQKQIPSDLPPIRAVFSQVEEIIFDLLDNAYDAVLMKKEAQNTGKLPSESGRLQGTVSVQARTVTVSGKPYVEIQVQDNGIGMTAETLKNIFVPFFTTKATAVKGTGLGLYVIKRILEAQQGLIAVDSRYGTGTTFRISFPVFVSSRKS